MSQQTVEFVVWLGIALLALIWATLGLWRAHRVLSQSAQRSPVHEIGFIPPAVLVPDLAPSAMTEQTSPALAS
jgi:uncharacterized protein (DUF58 family)